MLKRLSNEDLTLKLRTLVHEERKITLQILELICESERRRLFAESGYSSLFDWLTRELGYSEGAAQRRIESARLLRAVPSVAEKIESGSLSLTNLAKVGSTLRRVKSQKIPSVACANDGEHGAVVKKIGTRPMTEAMELIGLVEGKSSRQAEALLAEKFPELPKPDFVRKIDHETVRAQVTLTKAQHEKLERVREIASHHGASLAELIEIATDEFLKRRDPLVREVKARRTKTSRAIPETPHAKLESRDAKPESQAVKLELQSAKSESRKSSTAGAGGNSQKEPSLSELPPRASAWQGSPSKISSPNASPQRAQQRAQQRVPSQELAPRASSQKSARALPAKASLARKPLAPSVRSFIFRRAHGACEFRDATTGLRCAARLNLEIDHVTPLALGGSDAPENLRALCRSHNLFEAARWLGAEKMNSFRRR